MIDDTVNKSQRRGFEPFYFRKNPPDLHLMLNGLFFSTVKPFSKGFH